MNIIGKQQQIGILGVLLRNKDIPLWVIDAYVTKFEETTIQSEAAFIAKRNSTLQILNVPIPTVTKPSFFNTPDLRVLADTTWSRLLNQPPSAETLEGLTALLMQNGEIPAYFRRTSWTYLTSKYTQEAEVICKKILASPTTHTMPLNIDSAAMEAGYYNSYRTQEDGTVLSSDALIPIDKIYEAEGHVWSVFYVRGNRLLMADAHRTFRELKLFETNSPLFPSFCDVLVAVISSSKTPYVQGLTYLCGVSLLYSKTLCEAVGIALRVTQISNVYRSFILMEKERIDSVSCAVIKIISLILSGECFESDDNTQGQKLANLFNKKKIKTKEPLGLAYYGFKGYASYFNFCSDKQTKPLSTLSSNKLNSTNKGILKRSSSTKEQNASSLEPLNVDTSMSIDDGALAVCDVSPETPRMSALHRKIRLCTYNLFQSNFDTIFEIVPAITSSCVLTIFSKASFEISLFAMDYLSYTEDIDRALILMTVTLIMVALCQTSLRTTPSNSTNPDDGNGDGVETEVHLADDEIAEAIIKDLTKVSIDVTSFIMCFRDIVKLSKKSEAIQQQIQTLDAIFAVINND